MKRGKYVTTHLHLNVTYLMEADPVQEIRCKPDENSAVGWIPVEQIAEKSTERGLWSVCMASCVRK